MPEIWAGRLGEFRAMSTASGGTALTTAATFIEFPALNNLGETKKGHLFITPRNLATAVVAKIAFNPWLTVLKTANNMATAPTDYSIYAQDSSTSTHVDLSSLDTEANGDWLLVGSHIPFRGAYGVIDGTNSTGSRTLSVAYWDGGAWSSYSITNGMLNSTAFDQSGLIYWTVVTNWIPTTFRELYPSLSSTQYYSDIPLYWTKWTVNGTLDSTTTLDSLVAANRSTTYGELIFGQTIEEMVAYGFGGLGCIEALTDAGTANLVLNIATLTDARF